jgi:hypothetical protein
MPLEITVRGPGGERLSTLVRDMDGRIRREVMSGG